MGQNESRVTHAKTENQGMNPRTATLTLGAATGVSLATAVVMLWPDAARAGFATPYLVAAFALAAGWAGQVFLITRLSRGYRTLSLIGEALDATANHEPDLDSLRITADATPAAGAWNRLIEELTRNRHAALSAETSEKLTAASAGSAGRDAALDALHHGVVIVNPEGNLRSVNGAACRMLMRSREQLTDAPFDKLADVPELLDLVQKVLSQPASRGGAVEMKLNPGDEQEAVVRATVRPIGKGTRRDALVVFEDVTQQRTADQSRNLFVAQATHELRTPLTNIGLYLERAIDLDDDATADRAECLNVINSEVLRLGRVVEEVLSVSEIEAGSLKVRRDDVRVDEMIRRLEEEYGPQAREKSIALSFDLPPKLAVVQGDRDKIGLALHNLVGNAIKYTPEGGAVRVAVEEGDRDIHVEVTDSGIGIGEADLQKVFEKFYRADDPRLRDISGSGLGLALAREVIRLHGGDITVESTLNEGSTFALRLPVGAAATTG